jgi:hypothetical protein
MPSGLILSSLSSTSAERTRCAAFWFAGSLFFPTHAAINCSGVIVAPLKFALEIFAPFRIAPVKSAPEKSAPSKPAPSKLARFNVASIKWVIYFLRKYLYLFSPSCISCKLIPVRSTWSNQPGKTNDPSQSTIVAALPLTNALRGAHCSRVVQVRDAVWKRLYSNLTECPPPSRGRRTLRLFGGKMPRFLLRCGYQAYSRHAA